MKFKNLSLNDIKILKEKGVPDKDFQQIDYAISVTIYEFHKNSNDDAYKKVSKEEARELLGDEAFLSGIERSAFHMTSLRECKNGGAILFDSSKVFR